MKRAAALIIAFCVVMCAFSPVVVKAAADDLYYITYQANIGNQELVDRGIVQNTANGSVSYYMVNNQIQSYNDLQFPVDLSDYDYYMITGSNTWQGDNFSGTAGVNLVVYNSDSPLLCYKAAPSLSQFYFDNASYKNGTYSWDRGSFVFYGENIKEMSQNGDFKAYSLSGSNWNEYTYAFYNDLTIPITGSFIASTNQPLLYAGEDIAKNSTVSVSSGYDLTQVKQWLADGVNNSESIIDYFQVTKDGVNYDSWGDVLGPTDPELNLDQSLTFASCDCVPVQSSKFSGMKDAQLQWVMDTGSFDFTFGGDQTKHNLAANKWGVAVDIELNYTVDTLYSAGNIKKDDTYKGTVYSHLEFSDMNSESFYNSKQIFSIDDVLKNAVSYTGSEFGSSLLVYLVYDNNSFDGELCSNLSGVDLSSAKDFLGPSSVFFPILMAPPQQSFTYSLSYCRYDLTFYPLNTGLNIKGQTSSAFSNLLTGEHGGTATGAVIPPTDPNGMPTIMPDNSTGTQQNYLIPADPNGSDSMGYAIVEGSPSNSSSSATANGGNANVTVNASPVITIENGVREFAEIMSLSGAPKTLNNSIWGAFGYFKDNPAIGLYREYFGSFPDEFRNFILACATICFGIGVWRFVRGRNN